MKMFNRELILEQIIEIVRCNAEPESDLIHAAALELADAVETLNCFGESQSCKLLKELQRYRDTGLTPEEIMDGKMLTGWIPVEERLPSREEFLKNDGRFIASDGNRVYQSLFDVYNNRFVFSIDWGFGEDKCIAAWMPLPEKYSGGE